MYLNSVSAIDLHFTLVIFPDNTELNDAFRDLASIAKARISTVTTDKTFFNSGRFSKSVLLSRVDKISSLACSLAKLVVVSEIDAPVRILAHWATC
jgi:hypothetical protein